MPAEPCRSLRNRSGRPIAKIAARVMVGEPLANFGAIGRLARLRRGQGDRSSRSPASPVHRTRYLDQKMKSTGEVMGIARDFDTAFAKALLGAGMTLPQTGTAFVSVKDGDKDNIVCPRSRKWSNLGSPSSPLRGTAAHLQRKGLPCRGREQGGPGRPHIVDRLLDRRGRDRHSTLPKDGSP